MQFAVYLTILIGWAGIPFVRGKLAMLVAPALITTLLFFFSLIQQLALGVLVVKIAGLASAVFTIALAFKSVDIRKSLFGTGIAFLSIFFLSFFASHGRNYWAWDEFSHWGAQVEYLLAVGNLDRHGDVLLFPDYIPGLNLWRYFARTILVDFGVAAAYFSGWIIVFSCFIVALGSIKKIRFIAAFLVCSFLFISFFQSLPLTLYADPVQAALLMCGLALSRNTRNGALAIVPVVILLILSKHVGLIFCLFIFLYYFSRRHFIDQKTISATLRDLMVPFSVVSACFLAWKYYVDHYHLSISQIDLKKITALNPHEALTHICDVFFGMLVNKFPHSPFHESLFHFDKQPDIGLGGAVIASLLISYIFISITNKTWPEKKLDICFVSIFVLFYITFLTGVRATTPWGGDIYSFSRYISVVLFAVSTFLIPDLFEYASRPRLLLAITIALPGLAISPKPEYLFSLQPFPPVEITDTIERKAREALSHVGATDRLWYIFDEKNALHHFIFKMKSIPFHVESHLSGYNIFYNSNGADWPEKTHRFDEFSKHMCSVDFLYIDDASDFFWEDYGELFDKPKSGKLYRVKKGSGDRCMAVLVKD